MNIDHTILTLIVAVPLVGALLLAFLPDRGKTMQWAALAVTLITFLMTLHLPFHYLYGAQAGTFRQQTDGQFLNVLHRRDADAQRFHQLACFKLGARHGRKRG